MFLPCIAPRLLPSCTSVTAAVIKFSIINFSLTFFVLGFVAVGVRVLRTPRPRDSATVTGAVLDYFILFSIVVTYVYNFVVHSVFGDFSLGCSGWAQCPFQLEVAFASLGFAVVGLVASPVAPACGSSSPGPRRDALPAGCGGWTRLPDS